MLVEGQNEGHGGWSRGNETDEASQRRTSHVGLGGSAIKRDQKGKSGNRCLKVYTGERDRTLDKWVCGRLAGLLTLGDTLAQPAGLDCT